MVWLIWELAPTRDRQLDLLQAYVLGCYVSVMDTVMKFLAGIEQQTGRFAATGFNPNDLGYTLVLAIPMAWCLALMRPKGLLTWVNRLYVGFGMIAVILTASRGSFIPAFAALLIIPWTLTNLRPRSRIAICVGGALSLLAIARFVPQTSWDRLSTASSEIESGSFNERGDIWASGLEALVDRPLHGVGAGAYSVAIEPILGWGRPPHQTFLSVLVGQGAVGLVLWLGMFAAAFLPVLKMPALERKLWLTILMTLGIGLQVRTWDYRKPLWLILGILVAHGVSTQLAARASASPRDAELREPESLLPAPTPVSPGSALAHRS
jgi:O-antigen ligase